MLAPAYDLLSTLAYIPNDDAALRFHRSREWSSFTYQELETIAGKARLPSNLVISTARDTLEKFDEAWDTEAGQLPFPADVKAAIGRHRKTLAI